MLEVQAGGLGGDQDTGGVAPARPPRFLEGADGVVHLFDYLESAGRVRGSTRAWTFKLDGKDFRLLHLENFCWGRLSSLKILQGNSLQGALGPRYIVVDAEMRPTYSSTPGLNHLYLAEPLFLVPADQMGELTMRLYAELRPVLSSL